MDKTFCGLIAFAIAWFIAQLWKMIAGAVANRKQMQSMNLAQLIGYFTRSGGMPSGHTASLTGMLVYFGCLDGFNSAIFLLGFGLWTIVVYDAIHVRYAVGEQGKALNRLLAQNGETELPIVEGHTVPQVIVGALMGIAVGLWMAYFTGILA